MNEHRKDFLLALNEGRDMDFAKNYGYQFDKDELISIIAELFYTAYQEATDGGCLPKEEQEENYKGFIRRFIDNMNEYESNFFIDMEKIADDIVQASYGMSAMGYNYNIDFNTAKYRSKVTQQWIEGNKEEILDYIREHDMVLEADLSEDGFDITFCSVDLSEEGDCNGNILYEYNHKDNRWYERSLSEIEAYRKENT